MKLAKDLVFWPHPNGLEMYLRCVVKFDNGCELSVLKINYKAKQHWPGQAKYEARLIRNIDVNVPEELLEVTQLRTNKELNEFMLKVHRCERKPNADLGITSQGETARDTQT